jgi:hypothetical protein
LSSWYEHPLQSICILQHSPIFVWFYPCSYICNCLKMPKKSQINEYSDIMLLTMMTGCSKEFPKLNYTSVTSVCNIKVRATPSCCAAFNELACKFQTQVNDFNTICPILFISYLNLAGGYENGYFIGNCIDGNKGLCV